MTLWEDVRNQFVLDPVRVNLAALSLAPHHRDVRRAIAEYADKLDTRGWPFLSDELSKREQRVRDAVAAYFFIEKADNVSLIDGTTQGLALMYAGVRIRRDQEILTSQHEYAGAYECFQFRLEREERTDFVRSIPLFNGLPAFSSGDVLEAIRSEVRPSTRILALTWVYSNTGVKLPIAEIGAWVRTVNETRSPENKIIFCVDGVHGFGVEDTTFPELNCDFFVAGCHKWIFGPRGTGVWLGTDDAWREVIPLIPATTGEDLGAHNNTPGGLHSYEVRWALAEAFDFLDRRIGKRQIQQRVHVLASGVKTALLGMSHVDLITPLSARDSSGIICFDVKDKNHRPVAASDVVSRLARSGVVVTTSSMNRARPKVFHVRLSVSILNTDADIRRALEAIRDLV